LCYKFLGFVDDDWPGMQSFLEAGHKTLIDFDGLAEFLRHNVVDEIISYLPLGSYYQHSSQVAFLCEQHGITMRMACDIFELKGTRWRSEELGGLFGLATYTRIDEFWSRTAKRALDITVAGAALILLSPVLLCTAIAIAATSRGPIFFLQERVGLNKRRFKVYKFRTMVPNAEKLMAQLEAQNEAGGPVFKMTKDPRVTPIGRLLRKSSIDELPQLLNVLRGDMSLVGPRPLPVRDYAGFSEDWQRRRLSVKPGITCLWQVNGRSVITFEQWMRLDLQYMDEWSFWLDLKILARTVPAVLRGAGAV
jgi:exopolysaccharide biosynthesis polyprenyl glycosylphosphotransferase